ncbi:MAG: hypothetical protein IPQ27_13220 [Chitinophagaceae bacterium]|nr:hypothetical protein [Chitinophagaceae bacterium]MBL0255842.1 hypothetical protein [Chitinophagaceae bacterium]
MRFIATILILVISLPIFSQSTDEGKVEGWNYIATMPANWDSTKASPALIFFPGLGEIGTNINLLKANGVHAYNGISAALPDFVIISLQPVTAYPSAAEMNKRIDCLKVLYNLDNTRLNFTGLSHGGWCTITMVQNQNSPARTITTVEGVQPGDNVTWQPDTAALKNFTSPYICFEQKNDYRKGDFIVNYLNKKTPGQAQYILTNFGNGGHCCWSNFYGNGNSAPSSFVELNGKTLYAWLTEQNNTIVLGITTLKFSRSGKLLKWSVDSETDVDSYEVQSTTDGRNYKIIKTLKPNGKKNYSLTVN